MSLDLVAYDPGEAPQQGLSTTRARWLTMGFLSLGDLKIRALTCPAGGGDMEWNH